jgi:hypothetical protein
MTNKATPESTTHSSTFKVRWTYWWTGTWASLFRDPSIFRSSPAKFTKVDIAGGVDSTYLEKAGDKAVQNCSSAIFRDPANRPTVSAAYDTAANTLQVVVEAPTFRGNHVCEPELRRWPGRERLRPGHVADAASFVQPGRNGRDGEAVDRRHGPLREDLELDAHVRIRDEPCADPQGQRGDALEGDGRIHAVQADPGVREGEALGLRGVRLQPDARVRQLLPARQARQQPVRELHGPHVPQVVRARAKHGLAAEPVDPLLAVVGDGAGAGERR